MTTLRRHLLASSSQPPTRAIAKRQTLVGATTSKQQAGRARRLVKLTRGLAKWDPKLKARVRWRKRLTNANETPRSASGWIMIVIVPLERLGRPCPTGTPVRAALVQTQARPDRDLSAVSRCACPSAQGEGGPKRPVRCGGRYGHWQLGPHSAPFRSSASEPPPAPSRCQGGRPSAGLGYSDL